MPRWETTRCIPSAASPSWPPNGSISGAGTGPSRGLEVGDPDGNLAAASLAAQLFRKVYAAGNRGGADALTRLQPHCERRRLPDLHTLARTRLFLAAPMRRTSSISRLTASVGPLRRLSDRPGSRIGFQNFENYRLRLPLRRGATNWDHEPGNRFLARNQP
jgi:hypothetical protein